jgi:ABC-2 type transport system permease protein
MMRRILQVARREYLAYVRTKTFILSVVMLPLILALAFGLPAILESMPKPPRAFTVIDETGRYAAALLDSVRAEAGGPGGILRIEMRDHVYLTPAQLELPADAAGRGAALQARALGGDLFAWFVIRADSAGRAAGLDFYTMDVSSQRLAQLVRRHLNRMLLLEDLRPRVADLGFLERALRGVDLSTHAVTASGEEAATIAHAARAYAPLAFVYLLWIAVLTMSSHLMTSTIEEKTSRIIEVLLSSVSPFEFLMGKLVGLAGAGLTQLAAWAAAGVLISSAIPGGGAAQQILGGLAGAFTGLNVIWFVLFFLLGFLFYASFYIGVGSVCNTLREAQNLLQPVMIVMMIPLFLMVYVTNNPDHVIAIVGSFVPPFTPFLMINRIPATPPAPVWQILAAAALMLVSTWAAVRGAAKVFRIGVLMYGKRPTLPEILRWARRGNH